MQHCHPREPWIFSYNAEGEGRRIADVLEHFEPLPESYAGQFYRFYQALKEGIELPVTLTDARATLELLSKYARRSRLENRPKRRRRYASHL